MRFHWSFILFLFFIISSCQSSVHVAHEKENDPKHYNAPYVILISIDGYRHDYTKMHGAENIKKFGDEGIYSKGLIPSFPSKTFPNHYSIITGLRAAHHGIVGNSFWDPKRQQRYKLGDATTTTDGTWYGGEPIWIAAEKQGMLSASFFWVGSDANIQGKYPPYYVSYDGSIPNEDRVEQVLNWLKLPEAKRPHFITLYFSDVDSAGHDSGAESKDVATSVHSIDKEIGHLVEGLKNIPLPVNVIIVSDHGMHTIDHNKQFFLEDYIDVSNEKVRIDGSGTLSFLYFKDKKLVDTYYNKLKKAPHLKVYRNGTFPKSYGFNNNDRTGDLTISVKTPWYMNISRAKGKTTMGGTHGYDPINDKEMWGIFYAKGPNVKNKKRIKSFDNIHIYPFIMKILGLRVKTKIDGKADVLSGYYKK